VTMIKWRQHGLHHQGFKLSTRAHKEGSKSLSLNKFLWSLWNHSF
jgi:hypothetical protein